MQHPILALVLIPLLACREIPPTSGTPLRPGESVEIGVVREHNGWSLRRADLVSSGERLARDVGSLIGTDGAKPVGVLMLDTVNRTALPAGSFAPIRAQLARELQTAGVRRGIRFLRPGDPGATKAPFVMESEVRGLARKDLYFVFDFRLSKR